MFGRLRLRFVLISMLSVVVVLGVIISGINFLNYRSTVQRADEILLILKDNRGEFPPPPSDDHGMRAPGDSPEVAFEARYFSVVLDGEGGVVSSETERIAALSPEQAEELAREVYGLNSDKGFSGDYRYLKSDEDGNVRIIFYDCGRGLDSFRTFLKASVLISLIGMAVVFVLIYYASGRVVGPVAESYEKQKRFITDAGHEIKTPLAIINADADVILTDGENQWASDIKDQVGRLTELTNELIYLSRMEEGLPELSMTSLDLTKITEGSCDSFSSMYFTGNKKLNRDIEPGVGMKGDEKSIMRLMSILLDNALKYSPEGGTTEVSLKKSGKGIVLTVTNNTVDVVDKESARHLFDRFYRTDKSRSSSTGGYGIGLSVAQAIVNAHKGRISAVPAGTKLTITAAFPESC